MSFCIFYSLVPSAYPLYAMSCHLGVCSLLLNIILLRIKKFYYLFFHALILDLLISLCELKLNQVE